VLEAQRERGLSENMTFYNAVLDALWELGQHARAVKLMQSALARGTFPEAVKRSETIWAVDVHRMSSGAALALLYSWLVELRAIRKVGVGMFLGFGGLGFCERWESVGVRMVLGFGGLGFCEGDKEGGDLCGLGCF
jgi:hypothetical protein